MLGQRKTKISFMYTGTVMTPAHLAGLRDFPRMLYPEDAQLLKEQGYGYIESEGPPPKPLDTEDNESEISEIETVVKETGVKDARVRNTGKFKIRSPQSTKE